jgi:hypothetical protein
VLSSPIHRSRMRSTARQGSFSPALLPCVRVPRNVELLQAHVFFLVLIAASKEGDGAVVHPPWECPVKRHGHVCTDASTDHSPKQENNTRWSFWALPDGPAPAGGFPVYVELLAEIFSAGDWRKPGGPRCGNSWVPPPDGFWRPKFNVFDAPVTSMSSCFRADGSWEPLGWHAGANCSFFQKAGQLWVARLHQYLLANGIAILLVNPYAGDTWEWDDPQLPPGTGLDQPFFAALFGSMQTGTYAGLGAGYFNTQQLLLSGFSDGAQMTSWMIELQARQQLPAGVKVVAGVFLSGGSHRCYFSPPEAVSNCARCSDTKGNCGGGSGNRGCSLVASPLCCSYCCPANWTEDFYAAHPEAYASHPPCFLAQSAASDFNADLCAAKVYFDTLQAHGVLSQLVLLQEVDAPCACVGAPTAITPEGRSSPLAKECALKPPEPHGDRGNCIDHVTGFAAMVVPLTNFLLQVLATL